MLTLQMQCPSCSAASRVLAGGRGKRVRECERGHRWPTDVMEVATAKPTPLPATRESVWQLRQQGLSMRAIADSLLMSTATVQEHLAAAPSLEGVWR